MLMSLLLSLGLGVGSIDFDTLSSARVTQIAKEVMVGMQAELDSRPRILIAQRPEPTPLGAIQYADGQCVMLINQNKTAWAQWGRFLNAHNTAQWDAIIAASVAHEMGHCLKESRLFAQPQFSVPRKNPGGLSGMTGLSKSTEMVLKQELFADTVAVIYAKETWGEKADAVIQTILASREQFSQDDPSHDTSQYLRAVLNEPLNRLPNETIGQTAQRVLSGVRYLARGKALS
jgi:hypothetical protein